MSVLIQDRSPVRDHLNLKCRCGRSLRARLDQAGMDITCWSCHATVRVPIPAAPGSWVAGLLRMGARQLLEARICTLLLIGALLVTGAFLVPNRGILAAGGALSLVMTGYGELIRRGSQGDWTARPSVGLGARCWRGLICLGAGFALVLPLIVSSRTHTPPKVTLVGIPVAAALVATLPLLMLATYGLQGSVRARTKEIAAMLSRHPVAVLMTLLILPMAIVAIEGVLFFVTRLNGAFWFLTFDLFPKLPQVRDIHGIPFINAIDYRALDDTTVIGFYLDGLLHGHSFVGSIPASLVLKSTNDYNPLGLYMLPNQYLQLRIVFTLVVVVGMLAVLAVQARWLGLLSTMDARRTAN